MNGAFPLLDPDRCRDRQSRLVRHMASASIDAVVVVTPEHVQYLTGHRWDGRFAPLAILLATGESLLVCPDRPAEGAATGEVRTYEAKWRSTLRGDQREAAATVLADWLAPRDRPRRVGVEFSACPPHVTGLFEFATLVDVEPRLLAMRRRKDPDELASLCRAIDATGAMFATAREMVRPGVNELDVFSALQAAAVAACGEPLTGTGNDYASGARGGPPRNRLCVAGELFILDLGPAYRGYFADTARTIAVDGRPTDPQHAAWERVRDALALVERIARPKMRCRDLYEDVRQWLAGTDAGSWSSHLGHGIGLSVHETPRLNPHWDDVLEVGDVIAVEPALYAPGLACGVRIENDYLVTDDGLERLGSCPLELA